jgi:hypothetical protein
MTVTPISTTLALIGALVILRDKRRARPCTTCRTCRSAGDALDEGGFEFILRFPTVDTHLSTEKEYG